MTKSPIRNEKEIVYGELLVDKNINYHETLDFMQEGKNIANVFSQVTKEINHSIQQFNYSIQSAGNIYFQGKANTSEGTIESNAKGKLLHTQ